MKLQATGTSRLDWSGDGLAIGIFEDEIELTGELAALDEKLSGTIKDLVADFEFKGKPGSTVSTRVVGSPIRKLILVGLGKSDALKLDGLRRAAAASAKLAKKERCKTLGISLPVWNGDAALTAEAIELRIAFLAELQTVVESVEIIEAIAVCRDPKDDKFLELS
ncbi:M17 family peptidase N-terminal domain-containing protein [Phormidesmis sp. 146-33]